MPRFRLAQQLDPTGKPDDRLSYTTPRGTTLACLLTACAGGPTYQSVYDRQIAQGSTHEEAIARADNHCLNNPCAWGN